MRENGGTHVHTEGRGSGLRDEQLSGQAANTDSKGPLSVKNDKAVRGFSGQRQGSGPSSALGKVEILASRSGRLDMTEAYGIQANADPEPQPRSRPQEVPLAREITKNLTAAVSKPDGGFQWPPQTSSHNVSPPPAHSNGHVPHLQPVRLAESRQQLPEPHPVKAESTQQAVSSLEGKSALGNPGLHMPMGMGRKGPASVTVEARLDTPAGVLDTPFKVAPIDSTTASATYDPKAMGVNTCPFRHGTVDAAPYPGIAVADLSFIYTSLQKSSRPPLIAKALALLGLAGQGEQI